MLHPIDSLYTVESVKNTVPVIVPYFSVDRLETCSCVILWSTNRKRCSEEIWHRKRSGLQENMQNTYYYLVTFAPHQKCLSLILRCTVKLK